jgi:membrane fusion protein (multidrug efflux system)
VVRQGFASVATLGLTLSLAGCTASNAYMPPPPAEVTVARPLRSAVPSYATFTGTTKAIQTVEHRARVKGFLKERHFKDGEVVKAGQLLLVIDEEPFQIALENSRAKLADAEANLKKAEQSKAKEVAAAQLALDQSSLMLAKIDETRNKTLLARNAGTRESVDQSEANRRKNEAQVEADRASLEQAEADYQTNILSAKANLEAARASVRDSEVNLGYCRISATCDGRITRRQVDVGNLVGDGQATVLATVLQDDPIYAYANVSENDLLLFRRMARDGTRKSFDKGDEIPMELGLADEEGYPHQGRLDYADPAVDTASGTVLSRGVFPNADRVIVPGLFVRIRVPLDLINDAILVPDRALGRDLKGPYLLVVNDKNIVERRDVSIGNLVKAGSLPISSKEEGDLRVILAGLGPGEWVIVNGLQKARPGGEVKPKRQGDVMGKIEPKAETKAETKSEPKAEPKATETGAKKPPQP